MQNIFVLWNSFSDMYQKLSGLKDCDKENYIMTLVIKD